VENITEEENMDSNQLDNLLEEGFFSPDKGPGLDGDSDEEDEEEMNLKSYMGQRMSQALTVSMPFFFMLRP
jgi:hypothetical protein